MRKNIFRMIAICAAAFALIHPIQAQDFSTTVIKLASASKLQPTLLNEKVIRIPLEMKSGNTQYVFVRKANEDPFRESVIEIAVPSINPDDLGWSTDDQIKLIVYLLKWNAELPVGFWAYLTVDKRLTVMANFIGDQILDMDTDRFYSTIGNMAGVVDKLEVALYKGGDGSLGIAGGGKSQGVIDKLRSGSDEYRLDKTESPEMNPE